MPVEKNWVSPSGVNFGWNFVGDSGFLGFDFVTNKCLRNVLSYRKSDTLRLRRNDWSSLSTLTGNVNLCLFLCLFREQNLFLFLFRGKICLVPVGLGKNEAGGVKDLSFPSPKQPNGVSSAEKFHCPPNLHEFFQSKLHGNQGVIPIAI